MDLKILIVALLLLFSCFLIYVCIFAVGIYDPFLESPRLLDPKRNYDGNYDATNNDDALGYITTGTIARSIDDLEAPEKIV